MKPTEIEQSAPEDEARVAQALRDLARAREKYRAERDRRLRTDGGSQYLAVRDEFASFDADPFVTEPLDRDPVQREHEVVIVGAGFGGLMMAAHLGDAGVRDVAVVDEAADVGGTWYWNRYPAAQCDIESYSYLPLLEETGYVPEHRYSYQPEIFAHAQRIARQYHVYDHALFQTVVTRMAWDEEHGRWRIATDRGDVLSARFVVLALGPGTKPKLPHVPGIESFQGRMFHTSRWDYGYTGGSTAGEMAGLADKRVGFVGTGSTGVSVAPYLAEDAGELFVFQRTPAMVLPRDQRRTDPDWADKQRAGWQRARQRNLEEILVARPVEKDLIQDSWTWYLTSLRPLADGQFAGLDEPTRRELADLRLLDQLRERVDRTLADPAVAELLKPWYRAACKRPTFSDTYLEMFNRPNVTLVDVSATKGIERFTPNGVVVGERAYELDCMILSTGFEWASSMERRMPITVTGRDGVDLHDHWRDGMRTFHGHSTTRFPNWFYLGRTQAALTVNFPATIDAQARNLAHVISEVRRRGARVVEATEEGESGWLAQIGEMTKDNSELLEQCTPGYINNEGQPLGRRLRFQMDRWTAGLVPFEEFLAEWRGRDDLAGLRLDAPSVEPAP